MYEQTQAFPKTKLEFAEEFLEHFQTDVEKADQSVVNARAKLAAAQLLRDDAEENLRRERVSVGVATPEEILQDMKRTAREGGYGVSVQLNGEEPVVIFDRFHGDLDAAKIVCSALQLTHCELSGRKNDSEKFHKGKAQVLIAQIRSGSLGIDLTRARYMVFYSTGVSLGDLEQAKKRVDRPGQTRNVTIYYLAGKKTVDEKIIAALSKRGDLVKLIVDDMRRK